VYVGVGVAVGGQGVKVGVGVHASGHVGEGVIVGVDVAVGSLTNWGCGGGASREQPASASDASANKIKQTPANDGENALFLPALWAISSSLPTIHTHTR
jgi:hypothetical protein